MRGHIGVVYEKVGVWHTREHIGVVYEGGGGAKVISVTDNLTAAVQ